MSYVVEVENIKCGGCANGIKTKLIDNEGISDVSVDIEAGLVTVNADDNTRENIVAVLAKMGYPETGSVEGLKSAAAVAKSYVSCAIGSMTDKS